MSQGQDHTPLLTLRQQFQVMAQHYAWESPGGKAFLVCIDCGKKIEHYFPNLYWMEDEDIAPTFTSKGWTIKPTRCPKCAAQKGEG